MRYSLWCGGFLWASVRPDSWISHLQNFRPVQPQPHPSSDQAYTTSQSSLALFKPDQLNEKQECGCPLCGDGLGAVQMYCDCFRLMVGWYIMLFVPSFRPLTLMLLIKYTLKLLQLSPSIGLSHIT